MIINLDGSAYIDAHIAKISKEMPIPPRPAVVVLPGGGYMYCSAREAEPVANQFKAAGCNTFTLFYRVMEEAKDKNPLIDVAKTIHHIREHAYRVFITDVRNTRYFFACVYAGLLNI